MLCETIDLYDYFSVPRNGAKGGYLKTLVFDASKEMSKRRFPAMLVFPGGGYRFLSDREQEPVALRFVEEGFESFVLIYSIETPHPAPLIEAAMAAAYIRENAEKYYVRKDKLCTVGFSAGGHLAATLATMYGSEPVKNALKEKAALARPDANISSYAVISTKKGIGHDDCSAVISGGDRKLTELLSLEDRVTKDSVPSFIWHTVADDCVPVENSLVLAMAYQRAGVPYELHLFEAGRHGMSVLNDRVMELPTPKLCAQEWMPLSVNWLRSRGFEAEEY